MRRQPPKVLVPSTPLVDEEEWHRLVKLTDFEKAARKNGYKIIAGVDEAGRGPLAGPVLAAACIIPENYYVPGVDDSKKLTAKKRQEIYQQIIKDKQIIYGVGLIEVDEIDRINIYQASLQAMLLAIESLTVQPDFLLVDGVDLLHASIPSQKIIEGDALSQSIAAASIIAKETRDHLMMQYHEKWPQYGFDQHKGYCTARHIAALSQHGPCPIHRKSFEPVKSYSPVPL